MQEIKAKLNLKTRPSSVKRTNRTIEFPQKFVTAYDMDEEEERWNIILITYMHNSLKCFIFFFILNLIPIRIPPVKSMGGTNNGYNPLSKEQYEYWPLFKQEDSPKNKVSKRKLYSHLVVSKILYYKI